MDSIVGVYNFASQPPHKDLLKSMIGVLKHRGLENRGYYILGNLGLAGTLFTDSNNIRVILDGQICNSQQLRTQLEIKGYRFRTETGAEVLSYLYEEQGIDFVKELRGDFAFVIYDDKKKLLFLVRDRIGKKALYYYADSKRLIFASEIKAILQDKSVKREVDFESLDLYLTLGYVPSPRTMFKGIYKLLPAHFMRCENGQFKIEKYWKLTYAYKQRFTLKEWESRILQLLQESISLSLAGMDSAGVFLSGGVDSSAIVLLAAQILKRPVKTFSIGFQDKDYSELKYARQVAERFGTEHHEFMVKPEVMEILPKLIWHYEEPFADSSYIPTYYAAQLAGRYNNIVLGGDGGDELFGGYERYIGTNAGILLDKCPRLLITSLVSLLGGRDTSPGDIKSQQNKIGRFLNAVLEYENPLQRYLRWVSCFYDSQKRELYLRTRDNDLDGPFNYFKDIFAQADGKDFIDKIMYLEIMTGLHNDSLIKVGIAARANSLEVRYPFLDHKLVEFAATIPGNLKLRGFGTKYILKKSLSKYIPREVLYRRKMGFGIPVGRWFRNEMKDYVRDHLLDQQSVNRGLFKKQTIERMLQEHMAEKRDYTPQIWALLNFELWHRMFIDGGLPE